MLFSIKKHLQADPLFHESIIRRKKSNCRFEGTTRWLSYRGCLRRASGTCSQGAACPPGLQPEGRCPPAPHTLERRVHGEGGSYTGELCVQYTRPRVESKNISMVREQGSRSVTRDRSMTTGTRAQSCDLYMTQSSSQNTHKIK